MNRFKISIIIIVVSICLGIFSLLYIQSTCGRLIEKMDEIVVDIRKSDTANASQNLQEAIDYFEKIKPVINVLEGQGESIEIRSDLNKAIFFFNTKDYESAILHLEECKTDLNRIIVSNIPSISTVL